MKKSNKLVCSDLLVPIEEVTGSNHMQWPDGSFVNGESTTPVKGVLVTWMADAKALRTAAERGCNVVLCHESPLYGEKHELPPYRWLNPGNDCSELEWHPNAARRALIKRHNLTLVWCHYGLDRFPIYDSFAEALGLDNPCHEQGWETVYQLPKAVTVMQLTKTVKQRLGITGTVRVAGDLARKVSRVVSLWGGIGLYSNVYWLRQGITHGAEVAVAGEMDEYLMHYAAEAGIPVIETSHRLSEEFGVRKYAEVLRRRYPGLNVHVVSAGRPYQTL